MRHLEFPVSAAAVRLHGREFHAQDFFDASIAPADNAAGSRAGQASSRAGGDLAEASVPASSGKASLGSQLRHLVRWTLICIALALAVAVVMSWLVRPDLRQVKWVDAPAPAITSNGG